MSAAAVVEKRVVMSTSETKTFRGSSLEEVLPKIKADLGPDAEIVRQREGLTGGAGGVFVPFSLEGDPPGGEAVPAAPGRVAPTKGGPVAASDHAPALAPPPAP